MKHESRIGELIKTVRDTYNRKRAGRINTEAVERMANRMLALLRHYQPPKYVPPPGEGIRRRAPHASISEGWNSPKMRTTHMGGASAIVENRSEHIDVIRYGHQAYRSPTSGRAAQRFYYRPEWLYNKQMARGLSRQMLRGLPPILTLYVTNHEARGAWGGGDFVVRAARQGKQSLKTLFHHATDEIAYGELRKFFGSAG